MVCWNIYMLAVIANMCDLTLCIICHFNVQTVTFLEVNITLTLKRGNVYGLVGGSTQCVCVCVFSLSIMCLPFRFNKIMQSHSCCKRHYDFYSPEWTTVLTFSHSLSLSLSLSRSLSYTQAITKNQNGAWCFVINIHIVGTDELRNQKGDDKKMWDTEKERRWK